MIITIPRAPNQIIPKEVLDSISIQTIKWPVYEIEGNKPSQNDDRNARIHEIVISRNRCLDRMADCDFALMHDSDCVITLKDHIEKMVDFLMQHDDFIAVAGRKLDYAQEKEEEPQHILCGSWLMRGYRFASLKLRFRYEKADCECRNMCNDIRAKGYRIGYVDHLKRVNDLHIK